MCILNNNSLLTLLPFGLLSILFCLFFCICSKTNKNIVLYSYFLKTFFIFTIFILMTFYKYAIQRNTVDILICLEIIIIFSIFDNCFIYNIIVAVIIFFIIFFADYKRLDHFIFVNNMINNFISILVSLYISWHKTRNKYGFLIKLDSEKRLHKQERKNIIMLNQIKPHFIFNVLGTIRALIDTDPDTAKYALDNFSVYLRSNTDFIGAEYNITFSRELETVNNFLELEYLRFGDKLNVEYDITVTDFIIPPLTVQPLVENAIKHGICKNKNGGTVSISSYADDNNIYICIKDDGVGFDTENMYKDETKHIGLKNVYERIKNQTNGTLVIESQPNIGTTATIILPKGETVK